MTIAPFNGTNLTSAFQYVNNSHEGLFGLFLILIPTIIIIGATIRYGEAKALLVGEMFALISIMFVWVTGLVDARVGIILFVADLLAMVLTFLVVRFGN